MSGGARPPLGEELDLLERPPGRIFHALVAVLALYTLEVASLPGWARLGTFFALALWASAALLWGVWVTAYNFLHVRRRKPLVPRSRLRWSVAPLLAGLTLVLIALEVPLRTRFALSRSALEAAASEVRASPDFVPGDTWRPRADERLGLFDVGYRDAIPGGARFLVKGAGLTGWWGFAYAPAGLPPASDADAYRPLGEGWYVWESDDGSRSARRPRPRMFAATTAAASRRSRARPRCARWRWASPARRAA